MHKWEFKRKYLWCKIYECRNCTAEKIVYSNSIVYSEKNEVILTMKEPQCANINKEKERLDMI